MELGGWGVGSGGGECWVVGNGSEEGGEGYGLWWRAGGREGYLWGRNMKGRRCMVYKSSTFRSSDRAL